MDRPGLETEEHAAALRGLGRINRVSRSDAILWPSIAGLSRAEAGRGEVTLRVLDLACGGGDVTRAIARRAARAGLDLRVDGCDVSPGAVAFARGEAARSLADVRFFRLDALNDPLPGDYDILCCSLFLHHLEAADAVALLRRMAAASRRMVLVNDLVRGRAGYLLAQTACRLLSRSPIVRWDGPTSVASAFSAAEALGLADAAGLAGATLTRHWPQRFLLTWRRP